MTAAWDGELLMGLGFALFRGLAGDNEPHAHHALQLVAAESGTVEIACDDGRVRSGEIILVPADEVHRVVPSPAVLRILYFEPSLPGDGSDLELTLARMLIADDWREQDWRARLAAGQPQEARIGWALDYIDANIRGRIGATELARVAKLSRNRLMLLFAREVGLPVRRYILWTRLKLAARAIAAGASVTDAAHEAGFADAAHFARTMKATFGVSASHGLGGLRITLL